MEQVMEQSAENTLPMDSSLKQTITEGSAVMLLQSHVFYNPVQQLNRDLSICVLKTFIGMQQEQANCEKKLDFTVLEALSASGLRSIRYAKEVPGITKIIANDLSQKAVDTIQLNVEKNGVDDIVKASHANAITLMYESMNGQSRFSAIDLDPYGCPTRFLDSAVQSVADKGILLVTATDMAVLAGNSPETCYVKYGSISLKTKACHEMALRILLHSIEAHATRYGRYIKPLLSVSVDFYIRVFVQIFTSPRECKNSTSKQSMVFQCTGCESVTFQPLGKIRDKSTPENPNRKKHSIPTGPFVDTNCQHCGFRHHMGGPIWTDRIHDEEFLTQLHKTIRAEPYNNLGTSKRIQGLLTVVQEELHDVPLYYSVEKMCSILKLEVIPILNFRSALLNANYSVSFSHAFKSSIKTNAPPQVLWDILRAWALTHPIKAERIIDGTPLKAIISKPPLVEYDLQTIHKSANPESRKKSLARFPENPASHWGPGIRASVQIGTERIFKSIRNQSKSKKLKLSREAALDADVMQ